MAIGESGSKIAYWYVVESFQIPIPFASTFYIFTPKREGCNLSLVFITVEVKWDLDLLRSLLSSEEVDLIHTLPLSKHHFDRLIWHYDQIGFFTIKNAYHVAHKWILPPSLTSSHRLQAIPSLSSRISSGELESHQKLR
ncbi:unnamed protein product [Malus baccata var. baccata]